MTHTSSLLLQCSVELWSSTVVLVIEAPFSALPQRKGGGGGGRKEMTLNQVK